MSKTYYINDYVDDISDRKAVRAALESLWNQGISNRSIKVKTHCAKCDKEITVIPSAFLKGKSFRCDQHKYKGRSGVDSPFYNRILMKCTECGKEFYRIPAAKNINADGDSHNFCSRACYSKFRSRYYKAERGPMYHHEYTEEQLKNLAGGTAKRAKKIDRLNSDIQAITDQILKDMGVTFEREKCFDYYSCDNYLSDYNLIIEVMGDYWHANPTVYNESQRASNEIQCKTVLKDKQKKSYISGHYNIPILYLWGKDLFKDLEKCRALIKEFIYNRGALINYHSFNYHFDDNGLHLNDNIILSYQDQKQEAIRSILKK